MENFHSSLFSDRPHSTYPFIDPSRHTDRLKGKTALITGAGRGIGKQIALAFGNAGARVICVARRQQEVDDVASEINDQHQPLNSNVEIATGIAADVANPTSAATVVNEVYRRWSKDTCIDILIANAGMTRFNTVENENENLDDWWRVFEVNLRGTVAFIRALLPGMRARGFGILISLASTSGSQDIPFNTAYACSKAAIIKFNQDLGVELEGSGICYYAMHPRSVGTSLASAAGAVNMKEVGKNEKMRHVLGQFEIFEKQTVDLPANTAVALCVEGDAVLLSGKYIDSQQDLAEVLAEAKKGKEGRIEKEKLYRLRLDES